MKRIKYNLGSIVAIPLSNGQFAYAKVHKNETLGVYDIISSEVLQVDEVVRKGFVFHQPCTDSAIKNGDWPVVGVDPFLNEEAAWPPPLATCYVKESNEWTMGGIPRVSFKGGMHIASLEEVQGLWILSASNRPEVFIRLIEDVMMRKNGDYYKVTS